MKNTITKSTMVIASLGVLGNAYTPVQKPHPSRKFVESTYMVKTLKGYVKSNRLSEERKEILKRINDIRQKIVLTSNELKASDKFVDDCVQEIQERSNRKITRMQLTRAQELRVPIGSIKVDVLAKRKAIVIVDNFEI